MKKIISLILSLTMICMCLLTLASCSGGKCEETGTGSCEYLDSRDITDRDVKYVEMCVNGYGRVVILLDATTAPQTVENFVSLVEDGFYNGLTFHRIIEGFMIQGGDPDGNGGGNGPRRIFGEFSDNGFYNDMPHVKGVISMARGNGYDSASCQFFICNDDARASLDGKYAAFGYVVEGLDVIDKITKDVLDKCFDELYGNYTTWLMYGNGMLTEQPGYWDLTDLQPEIKHIRMLETWEKP